VAAIDFISDLHLAADHPRTVRPGRATWPARTADAVVMLGDVFEAWVGDDSRAALRAGLVRPSSPAARTPHTLAFMAGNRDFLVGPELLAAAGVTALPDPTMLQACGPGWVLAHGDAQCLEDQRYQAFRAQVRSPPGSRPSWPAAGRAPGIARAMRRESMRQQQGGTESAGDLDPEACRACCAPAPRP
jgi:UDP-2,3-diacylglucosamine hydrolase